MDKLFSKIKKETLSEDEKAKIFVALQSFVKENPVQSVRSPYFGFWFISKGKVWAAPVAFVLVFVLTSGTVVAAKSSLPGNFLYPVKILNEKVESLTAFNSKDSAEVDLAHAMSRLDEVEKLASSEGKFNKETREKIETQFEIQTQDAQDHIEELRNKGREKDASEIENNFKKYIDKFEKNVAVISESTTTATSTKAELSSVISNIRSKLEKKEDRSKETERTKGKPDQLEEKRGNKQNESTDENVKNNEDFKIETPKF